MPNGPAVPDAMLHWIGRTCRDARKAAGRMQVHVAASASVDQSTVNRFEQGRSWPRNADRLVAAYADDLDIDPIELWTAALDSWRADVSGPATSPGEAADVVEEHAGQVRQQRQGAGATRRRRRPAS